MAIALVACSSFAATGGGTVPNCATQDSTGANFAVASVGDYATITTGISDSHGNSWFAMSPNTPGTGYYHRLFYTVGGGGSGFGSGHDLTLTGGSGYGSVAWCSFSGGDTSAIFDTGAGQSGSNSSGTVQPGSLTPSAAGAVFVCGVTCEDNNPTIDSGFTMPTNYTAYSGLAIAIAFFAPSAGAKNPTWTRVGRILTTDMACFVASTGGGGGGVVLSEPLIARQAVNRAGTF